jgi:hypothetical protein
MNRIVLILAVSIIASMGVSARSAWHFHPLGQTLVVTQGCGWVYSEGQPKLKYAPAM